MRSDTKTLEQFIVDAREVHGDMYSYEKTVYTGSMKKMVITCLTHGDFSTTPNKHLRGGNCALCVNRVKLTSNSFIEKARKVHGDRYNYDNVVYTNNATKVDIVCKNHGTFWQRPNHHLSKRGCPECAKVTSNQEMDFADFIKSIYNGRVITNTKSIIPPYELDVYLPEENIAFEYNGMYWHEEGITKPIGYHDMKTNLCSDRGITLHHIWEDDWMGDRSMIEGKIKQLL